MLMMGTGNLVEWAQMLAAQGAGVSAEALEAVFRVQARMVVEDRGASVVFCGVACVEWEGAD